MSQRTRHPTTERLQDFVEQTLDEDQRSVVDAHLSVCAECRGEVEELEAVFGALAGLGLLSPSPEFMDRVMARVKVRRPAFAGASAAASAWIQRVTPQSTRGWAAATAILALPALGVSLLAAWLMSHPGVTAQGLWTMGSRLAGQALNSGWQWAWTRFAGTTLASWLAQAYELIGSVGSGEIGLAAVLFATLTAGSIYVLYQNLFRSEARRTEHATYVF